MSVRALRCVDTKHRHGCSTHLQRVQGEGWVAGVGRAPLQGPPAVEVDAGSNLHHLVWVCVGHPADALWEQGLSVRTAVCQYAYLDLAQRQTTQATAQQGLNGLPGLLPQPCLPACLLASCQHLEQHLHRAQLQALTCTQAPWQLHRLLLAAHTTHPTAPACSLPAAGRALLAWRDSQPAAQNAKQEGGHRVSSQRCSSQDEGSGA